MGFPFLSRIILLRLRLKVRTSDALSFSRDGAQICLGMNTTAGSFALLGSIVPRDATVIAKLRAAGAIILGKANMVRVLQH
jgi:hypothetical protein